MQFSEQLLSGTLLKRYKRFLADVRLDCGRVVTAHTANTGAMLGCANPGARVWLSVSDNPKRKYPYTWELVEVAATAGMPGDTVLVGINTQLSNQLVKEAIQTGSVAELTGYARIQSERPYGQNNSRIDLLLSDEESNSTTRRCFVEVKNVTLAESGVAYFPDAVTKRGAKHLSELQWAVDQGQRAVIFFCVQREDVAEFKPAADIDAEYARLLAAVMRNGVEAVAYRAEITTYGIKLVKTLPVRV